MTSTVTMTVAARQCACARPPTFSVRLTRQLGAADQETLAALAKAGLRRAPANER